MRFETGVRKNAKKAPITGSEAFEGNALLRVLASSKHEHADKISAERVYKILFKPNTSKTRTVYIPSTGRLDALTYSQIDCGKGNQ
jgi:hypothetical protein